MSCIKSIQRGSGSGNATITINKVDVNKTVVLLHGMMNLSGSGSYGGFVDGAQAVIALTSSTTIEITNAVITFLSYAGDNTHVVHVPYSWQVIEFA